MCRIVNIVRFYALTIFFPTHKVKKDMSNSPEAARLYKRQETNPWDKWGPYVSERGWGTVREDYSLDGDPWGYFPHEHARFRTYHRCEDGIAGISDRYQ